MKNFSYEEQPDNKKVRELVFSRAFRTDSIEKNGKIIKIKKFDGKWVTFQTTVLYGEICDILDSLYRATKEKTDEMQRDTSKKQDYSSVMEWTCTVILLAERSKRLYKERKSDEYETFSKAMDDIKSDIKMCIPRKIFLDFMYYLCISDERIFKEITELFGLEKIDDEDLINIIKNDIGKQDFLNRLYMYKDAILDNPKLLSTLEKEGYITHESLRAIDQESEIFELYRETRKGIYLKYLKTADYFSAYEEGLIDAKTLAKHTKLKDLIESNLGKDTKMMLLKSKIYSGHESELIWSLFESGVFSVEEIDVLSKLNYIRIAIIVEKYLEQQKRKIAKELNPESEIDEKKLLEIFTPEYVLTKINSISLPEIINLFITNELKELYKRADRDFLEELMNTVQFKNNDKDNQTNIELIELYERGMISCAELRKCEISEKFLVDYIISNGSNPDKLIEFYNNGLLSQDAVLEMFGDNTDVLFDMIRSGLNVSAIQTWYSTAELLNLYTNKKITMQNLIDLSKDLDFNKVAEQDLDLICKMIKSGLDAKAVKGVFSTKTLLNLVFLGKITTKDLIKLKDDIDIEELKSLYLSEEISYSQLYGLTKDKIIDIEDANLINEAFDLNESLRELMQRGLKGMIVQPASVTTKTIRTKSQNSTQNRVPKGLDPKLKRELFLALGSNEIEVSTVDCPVFSSYKLIPLMDKKVCILEGDGRTCVMPLKIVFEQLKNPDQRQNDILGTATCRDDVYSNKEHVTSLYHSKNWGRTLVKAVAERSSEMTLVDTKQLIQEVNQVNVNGKPLLEALQDSYIDRKNNPNRY